MDKNRVRPHSDMLVTLDLSDTTCAAAARTAVESIGWKAEWRDGEFWPIPGPTSETTPELKPAKVKLSSGETVSLRLQAVLLSKSTSRVIVSGGIYKTNDALRVKSEPQLHVAVITPLGTTLREYSTNLWHSLEPVYDKK